jgi:hypothetical protein
MIFTRKKPILTINYYGLSDFEFKLGKKLSSSDTTNIASFLYLLSYNSPIVNELINKLKDNPIKSEHTSTIVDSWATIYLADFNNPIIKPIDAFKSNVK